MLLNENEFQKLFQLKEYQRLPIINGDPSAPICIICENCMQEGYLFACQIFETVVYNKRRGPKADSNVPIKSKDCKAFKQKL